MTAPPASVPNTPERLARFLAAVAAAGDTPALIQLVAADAGYLQYCRWAAGGPGRAPVGFAQRLEAAGRQAGLDPARLRARLLPVARVLRLTDEEGGRPDPYAVLGLDAAADAAAVKRAYRRKARRLHPDTGGAADSRAFAELYAAYHTLGDAARRRAYDRENPDDGGWREAARRRPAAPRRRWPFLGGLGITLALLVAVAFLLDDVEREAALRSGGAHRPAVSARAPRTLAPPAPAPPEALPSAPPPAPLTAASAPRLPDPVPPAGAPASPEPRAAPLPTAPHPAPPVGDSGAAPKTGPAGHPAPRAAAPTPEAPAPAPAAAPLAVYVAGPEGAEAGRRLARALVDAGYGRPVVRPVAYAGASTVRYFHAADGRLARAVQPLVEEALAPGGGAGETVPLRNLGRRYPQAPPGRVEIWLNPPEPQPAPRPAALEASPAPVRLPEALEAAVAPAVRHRDRGVRLRGFLADYCRAYAAKDLDAFAAFFLPGAVENGERFQDLLPRYRRNLARMERLDYRIEVQRYALGADPRSLSLEGTFVARCRLVGVGDEVRENRGHIAMELEEAGESFRVRRLEYRSEAMRAVD